MSETPIELAGEIADRYGVYGGFPKVHSSHGTCRCRACFEARMVKRIRESVAQEASIARGQQRG